MDNSILHFKIIGITLSILCVICIVCGLDCLYKVFATQNGDIFIWGILLCISGIFCIPAIYINFNLAGVLK